ncbi:PmoA family protein, partial [bacterium]|nr:PmoA family protein [bacterium]
VADVGHKAHFFPLRSASGANLTRMGHPGAPNHDHHRSLWWAHHDVSGVDFWSEGQGASIIQKEWLAYSDGEEARMAVLLDWNHGEQKIMEQELVTEVRPSDEGEILVEIQTSFRASGEEVTLGKTNFGFLGIRMAKSISNHFGGGEITGSEGRVGEKAIFGKQARWMDYSGPVFTGEGDSRRTAMAGVTWFDHPDNPRYPTHWYVRSDGWMGASFCFAEPKVIKKQEVLVLRYLMHLRDSSYDATRAEKLAAAFGQSTSFQVEKSSKPHLAHEIYRVTK